jgi:hypothetical protein
MVASIREFGFTIPVLARSDGEAADGHLRLKAARELGTTEIPVILCDEWTPETGQKPAANLDLLNDRHMFGLWRRGRAICPHAMPSRLEAESAAYPRVHRRPFVVVQNRSVKQKTCRSRNRLT